jgi:hypothetical protein
LAVARLSASAPGDRQEPHAHAKTGDGQVTADDIIEGDFEERPTRTTPIDKKD